MDGWNMIVSFRDQAYFQVRRIDGKNPAPLGMPEKVLIQMCSPQHNCFIY